MPKIIDDASVYLAVIHTIGAHGYTGTTTRQMAQAAQISEVTLFRKYGSKQQLVRQAIDAIIQQTDFLNAVQYTGDVSADLLRILRTYQDSVVAHEQFFSVLFSEISRNPELGDSFEQPLQLFKKIGDLVQRYQRQGVLRQEHPLHAVAALLGPLIYLAMVGSRVSPKGLPGFDLEKHVMYFLEGRWLGASSEILQQPEP